MARISDVVTFLESFAPASLAEEWDNVGLLLGDSTRESTSILTCLTLTPDVAAEAVSHEAGLIVSHHPILFRPVQRLTADTAEGQVLLRLIEAKTAVYSPHTRYDSAAGGINQQLAESLGLTGIEVLIDLPETDADSAGTVATTLRAVPAGRCGNLPEPMPLQNFNQHVKRALGIRFLQFVGDETAMVARVGIACGSAAELLNDAFRRNCDTFLTGEARFHTLLEARSLGISLVLPGHYATERPAMERLAEILGDEFPDVSVRASQVETDPLKWA